MPDSHARFGTDLRLLRDLERQNDRDRGADLSTVERPETHQMDLETLSGAENLQQALLLSFLTQQGELAILGHPEYGSRLYTLIGELNNQTNRNRAKLYVLETLNAEPRVKQVRSVSVTQNRAVREQVDIDVRLVSIDNDTPVNLVFPFFFERGVIP